MESLRDEKATILPTGDLEDSMTIFLPILCVLTISCLLNTPQEGHPDAKDLRMVLRDLKDILHSRLSIGRCNGWYYNVTSPHVCVSLVPHMLYHEKEITPHAMSQL